MMMQYDTHYQSMMVSNQFSASFACDTKQQQQ
jgi:hypothetical protein